MCANIRFVGSAFKKNCIYFELKYNNTNKILPIHFKSFLFCPYFV